MFGQGFSIRHPTGLKSLRVTHCDMSAPRVVLHLEAKRRGTIQRWVAHHANRPISGSGKIGPYLHPPVPVVTALAWCHLLWCCHLGSALVGPLSMVQVAGTGRPRSSYGLLSRNPPTPLRNNDPSAQTALFCEFGCVEVWHLQDEAPSTWGDVLCVQDEFRCLCEEI